LSTPFQNRLVGTVIVAALAIIFLPDILDGDKKSYQEEFASIPKAPVVDIQGEQKTFPEEKLEILPKESLSADIAIDDENIEQVVTESVDDNNDVVKVATLEKPVGFNGSNAKKNTATQLPDKAVPREAWEIQLGSFRHQKNVDELVTKLRASGYTVFTKPIKTKSGKLTKVIVGPEFSKAAMEKQIPKLKDLTGVQGKISRFTPTK